MHYYLVAPNRLVRPDQDCFTYHANQKLQIGQVVIISLGKKMAIGIIIKQVEKPSFNTKPIADSVSGAILPKTFINLAFWMSDYYVCPLSQVIQTMLPAGIAKKRRLKPQLAPKPIDPISLTPTIEQAQAVKKILKSEQTTTILHGITGSGKTTVYIELAKSMANKQQSTIVIVPEIALTSQIFQQFTSDFNQVFVVHSKLTEAERHQIWQKCLDSTDPIIVIGARSALFTPINNLGLIIVDEFHDSSLKQDKNPRYHTIRVASKLATLQKAKLVLGSATPTVAERWLSEQKNSSIIEMSSPAQAIVKSESLLIDMKVKSNFSKHRFLSNQLLSAISQSLQNHEQSLIFHNHRGSAVASICEECGWTAICQNCNIPLTLHSDKYILICHTCGYRTSVPTTCSDCHSSKINHRGIGTKLIETELQKQFKDAKMQRFDGDSNQSETVDRLYDQLVNGQIDILIGTQVITKGLNLPNLSTVGVVQADTGLSLPDYLAEERNFQLIAQVVGRVGRNERSTKVIVQSYQPSSISIVAGLNQDYKSFYDYTINKRHQLNLPPFTHLLRLKVSYKTEASAIKYANLFSQKIKKTNPSLIINGPAPAFYEKSRDLVHWQLIIKSKKRSDLVQVIKLLPASHWQFDIDPMSLL